MRPIEELEDQRGVVDVSLERADVVDGAGFRDAPRLVQRNRRRAEQQLLELRFVILHVAAVHLEHVPEAEPSLVPGDLEHAEFRVQHRFHIRRPGARRLLVVLAGDGSGELIGIVRQVRAQAVEHVSQGERLQSLRGLRAGRSRRQRENSNQRRGHCEASHH